MQDLRMTGESTCYNGGSVEPEKVTGTLSRDTTANTTVEYTAPVAGTYVLYSVSGGPRFVGASFGSESYTMPTDGADGTDKKNTTIYTGTKLTIATGSGSIKIDNSESTVEVYKGSLKLDASNENNANDKCVKITVTEAGTISFVLNASGSSKDYVIDYVSE